MGAAIGVVANVVLGGGGGGLLGGLLNGVLGGVGKLVSGFLGGAKESGGSDGITKLLQQFSPKNVLNAAANLMNGIAGGAVKGAVDTLAKEAGMPKFIREAVHKAIDKALKDGHKPTDGDLMKQLKDLTKKDADKEISDLAKKIADNVRKQLDEGQKEQGAENSGAKRGGKKGAMSWLQAIAKAMGDTLGAKAAQMTELSQKVSSAADAQKAAGDDKTAQQEAAADMTSAQTELNGVTQEFKMMTETFNSAIKSLGESLSSLARRQ